MYFFIFQLEDMLKLCLNFSESQSIDAYKRYAYQKTNVFVAKFFFKLFKKGSATWLFLLLFIWNFHNQIKRTISLNVFWNFRNRLCNKCEIFLSIIMS